MTVLDVSHERERQRYRAPADRARAPAPRCRRHCRWPSRRLPGTGERRGRDEAFRNHVKGAGSASQGGLIPARTSNGGGSGVCVTARAGKVGVPGSAGAASSSRDPRRGRPRPGRRGEGRPVRQGAGTATTAARNIARGGRSAVASDGTRILRVDVCSGVALVAHDIGSMTRSSVIRCSTIWSGRSRRRHQAEGVFEAARADEQYYEPHGRGPERPTPPATTGARRPGSCGSSRAWATAARSNCWYRAPGRRAALSPIACVSCSTRTPWSAGLADLGVDATCLDARSSWDLRWAARLRAAAAC